MSFADKHKTSYCNIVKYLSLLYFGTFLSPLSYHFDSAGIVTLLKGENRSQRKSESLDEYLGRFKHTVVICRFAILERTLATLTFPGADGCCSAHSLSHHRLPLFPFKVKC